MILCRSAEGLDGNGVRSGTRYVAEHDDKGDDLGQLVMNLTTVRARKSIDDPNRRIALLYSPH